MWNRPQPESTALSAAVVQYSFYNHLSSRTHSSRSDALEQYLEIAGVDGCFLLRVYKHFWSLVKARTKKMITVYTVSLPPPPGVFLVTAQKLLSVGGWNLYHTILNSFWWPWALSVAIVTLFLRRLWPKMAYSDSVYIRLPKIVPETNLWGKNKSHYLILNPCAKLEINSLENKS